MQRLRLTATTRCVHRLRHLTSRSLSAVPPHLTSSPACLRRTEKVAWTWGDLATRWFRPLTTSATLPSLVAHLCRFSRETLWHCLDFRKLLNRPQFAPFLHPKETRILFLPSYVVGKLMLFIAVMLITYSAWSDSFSCPESVGGSHLTFSNLAAIADIT